MEYIIRKEEDDELIPNFEGRLLSDTLKEDYGYIYDSMIANRYDIRFENYSLLIELVDDEKVVGFVTFFIPQPSVMSLTETYVLPEFESKNLLQDIFLMLLSSGATISILKATRDLVEFLINNNYAVKLTDSLVTSAISFDMLDDYIVGDFNLGGVVPSSNLYDLNLCSPIFLYDISTPGACEIFYLEVLDFDDKKYNCAEFRDSVDIDKYFMDLKVSFLKNAPKFNQTLIDLKDSLPLSYIDYDEVIGEGDELSDYFEGMIEEGMCDRKTAVKIRNQLKKEYETEEVTNQSLALRVAFLLTGDEYDVDMDSFDDVNMQFNNFCPYCHSQVSTSSQYCHTCGYNVLKFGYLTADDIKK